jgi:hypothetical protein
MPFDTTFSSRVELVAHGRPGASIPESQLSCGVDSLTSCRGCEEPDRSTQHQRWRRGFTACRSTLVVSVTSKELFQVIVGARQIRRVVAVEQARPVTASHLEEVFDGARKFSGNLSMPRHGSDQTAQTSANTVAVGRFVIRQNVCNLMHPAERDANRWPGQSGLRQGVVESLLQLLERSRQPLFEATLAKLSATFVKRAWSFRPEACSGGRPSSVIALRTALQ